MTTLVRRCTILAASVLLFAHGTAFATPVTAKKVTPLAVVRTQTVKKTPAASVPKPSCVIKGNISSSREKIYHLPGCPNYGQTVITVSAGERMFCSEADARSAGWRKALNCPK